jgi:L-fucose isomerase-like protein
MNHPHIGFITCVHPLYDLPSVAARREEAIARLRASGCEVTAPPIPRSSLEAIDAAAALRAAGADLVVLFFCTWVGEDVTLALARELPDLPMLLWALPYLDRDIPMPSPISGLTASGSNIRRLGKRFTHIVGQVEPAVLDRVLAAARVAAVVRALRRARFGVVGYPCPGMVDVGVDEAELQQALGVTTVHLDLDALLRRAREASDAETGAAVERLLKITGGAREATAETLAANMRFYPAVKKLVEENRLDAYCVRCWPELRDHYRTTVCATHALMANEGIPSTCEVDLPALITTFVLGRLAGASAFNFDITAVLADRGALQFAHCGAADPALAGRREDTLLRVHMRTGTGLTVEFPFPEGRVTLAKLLRPRDGKLRLFAAAGRALAADGVRGSVAEVAPEPSAQAFLDFMLREAVEHHVALAYGSLAAELELFCEFTGIEFLPLAAQSSGARFASGARL